ncbi:hypothetical protein ACUV84_017297 [Puccinellia chinampoensis]
MARSRQGFPLGVQVVSRRDPRPGDAVGFSVESGAGAYDIGRWRSDKEVVERVASSRRCRRQRETSSWCWLGQREAERTESMPGGSRRAAFLSLASGLRFLAAHDWEQEEVVALRTVDEWGGEERS